MRSSAHLSRVYTQGLTLPEILIAVFIFGLIAGAVGLFGRDIWYLQSIFDSSLTSQQDARQILRQITAELREAAPSANGSYPLEAVGDNDLVFYSDIDNDGVKERVRYYVSGLILKKEVVEPTGNPAVYTGAPTVTNIVNDVRNGGSPVFQYFDTNYDGTTAPLAQPSNNIQAIRLIKINLAVDRDPYRSPNPATTTTQVSIRNLKDNL